MSERTTSERVLEIYETGRGLTTYEADFLDSIESWQGELTEKQEDVLCRIEEKAGTKRS